MAQPELQSIVTGDAHPTAGPHRISDKPGKDSALVTMIFVAPDLVRAWRIVRHGSGNRKTGEKIHRCGVVAGLDRCGTGRVLGRDPSLPVTLTITQPELGPEGVYPLDVYALDVPNGWGI